MSAAEPEFDWNACLLRARSGDEAAVRELLDAIHPLVVKIVRSHRARRAAEEDLVQGALIQIFQNLHQYSGAAPFPHWASRVAVNTCLKVLRAEKSRPEWRWSDLSEAEQRALDQAETPGGQPDAATALGSRDLVDKLMAALEPTDRLVIQLLHLEEKSVAEVKALTGWSTAGVKVRAFRARQRMKKELARLEKEELPWPRTMTNSLVY